MAELTKKADVSGLAGTYDAIVGAVAFPDGVGAALDKSSLNSRLVKKVSLASLQACVRNLEAKFFRQLQLLHEHELLSDLSDDDLSIHLLPEPVLPSVPEHDLPILPAPVL